MILEVARVAKGRAAVKVEAAYEYGKMAQVQEEFGWWVARVS